MILALIIYFAINLIFAISFVCSSNFSLYFDRKRKIITILLFGTIELGILVGLVLYVKHKQRSSDKLDLKAWNESKE